MSWHSNDQPTCTKKHMIRKMWMNMPGRHHNKPRNSTNSDIRHTQHLSNWSVSHFQFASRCNLSSDYSQDMLDNVQVRQSADDFLTTSQGHQWFLHTAALGTKMKAPNGPSLPAGLLCCWCGRTEPARGARGRLCLQTVQLLQQRTGEKKTHVSFDKRDFSILVGALRL